MTDQSSYPAENQKIDYERMAAEERDTFEPDQLDGPAADLDRTLDDANPG